jgi:hypothetical protein
VVKGTYSNRVKKQNMWPNEVFLFLIREGNNLWNRTVLIYKWAWFYCFWVNYLATGAGVLCAFFVSGACKRLAPGVTGRQVGHYAPSCRSANRNHFSPGTPPGLPPPEGALDIGFLTFCFLKSGFPAGIP